MPPTVHRRTTLRRYILQRYIPRRFSGGLAASGRSLTLTLLTFIAFILISVPAAQGGTTVTVGCGNSYYNYPNHDGTSSMDFSTTCTYNDSSIWFFSGLGSMRRGTIGSPCNYTETFCACGADYILCTCRNRDNGCADYSGWFKPVATCDVVVSASPASILPQMNGNSAPTSRIAVSLNSPAPSGGCAVKLSVEPMDPSGGHSHYGNRPKGSLTPNTFSFPAGATGTQYANYTSGAFSGTEKILATVNGTAVHATTVKVQVPGLIALTANDQGYWSLTGQTGTHPHNHYGTTSTLGSVAGMAIAYYKKAGATLGINDISLEWGGLFDWKATWSPPHSLHRKGTSVDIDTCAKVAASGSTTTCLNRNGITVSGAIKVDKIFIEKICNFYNGKIAPEASIHCEFP